MSFSIVRKGQIEDPSFNNMVHGSLSPAEIRIGEAVSAEISHNGIWNSVRVWRVSPLGIEFIGSEIFQKLELKSSISIRLRFGFQSTELKGIVVSKEKDSGREMVGVRYASNSDSKWEGDERRDNRRWLCGREFMPTGVAPNPGRYNDFIFFKINDFSKDGMQILTSLRNKFLVPGINLECSISLPAVGQISVVYEIKNVRIAEDAGKEVLALGGEFKRIDRLALGAIGQYVFMFSSNASIKSIRESGLSLKETTKAIEFGFVRTEQEYLEVLDLRRRAYREAGKLANDSDVMDIYDSRARIIIGKHKGKIVASTRLIYNETEDQMEHEQFVQFPDDFPRKHEICEITRVCTDPDFRGSDLLMELFRFVGITVVQSKRRFVLGCATDKLLPLYLKLGFKTTGMRYSHASLNNVEHEIFIGDVYKGLSGARVNPIVWNIVWREVAEYMLSTQMLSVSPSDKFRIKLYTLLAPIANLLYWLKKSKK